MSYQSIILAESTLVSYWPLNETHGIVANDIKDSNNGTYKGNFTLNEQLTPLYTNGILTDQNTYNISSDLKYTIKTLSPAVLFDGFTSYVQISDASNLHSNSVSLEAWVNTSSIKRQVVFDKYIVHGNGFGLNIRNQFIEAYIGNDTYLLTNIKLNKGWNHVVVTIDVGNIVNIYLNRILIFASLSSVALSNSNTLYIGKSQNFNDYFNGFLMHCAIYNVTLSKQQIVKHYLTAKRTDFKDSIETKSSLISYYTFSEGSSNQLVDLKSNNNGTYVGSVVFNENNTILNSGFIHIPAASNINTLSQFTIEMVVENIQPSTLEFINKSNLKIYLDSTRGLGIWTGSAWIYSGSLHVFSYLALTYDSSGNLFFYTDGIIQPLFDANGYTISYPITINYSNSSDLFIISRNLNFTLDYFAIYNDALTDNEVLEHYIKFKGLTDYEKYILTETSLLSFWPLRDGSKVYRDMSIYGVNAFNIDSNFYTCSLNYNYNNNHNFIAEYISRLFNNNLITPLQITALNESGSVNTVTNLTIELWVLIHSSSTKDLYSTLGVKYPFNESDNDFQVLAGNIDYLEGFLIGKINHTFQFWVGSFWVDSHYIIDDGIPHHLIASIDSSGNIKLYVDSNIKYSQQLSFTNILLSDSAFTTLDSFSTSASIWSLALYNQVLADDIVRDHYINGTNFGETNPNVPTVFSGNLLNQYPLTILSEATLISYWKMNESFNNTINDSKDNNPGHYKGATQFGAGSPGNNNLPSSFNFQPPNYFLINDASNLLISHFSLETWFNTTSSNRQLIFSKYNPTPPFYGFALEINKGLIGFYGGTISDTSFSTNYTSAYINAYNTSISSGDSNDVATAKAHLAGQAAIINSFDTNFTKSSSIIYNDGKWHHLVATINEAGQLKVYLDSQPIINLTVIPGVLTDAPLYIGADSLSDPNAASNTFNGFLMHSAIYLGTLTQDQVNLHYELGSGSQSPINQPLPIQQYTQLILNEPSLVSYWKMDELTSNIAYDFLGFNNGIYTNAYSLNSIGYQSIGPSVKLNGGYIDVANAVNLRTFTQITLEIWVNINSVSGQHLFFSKLGSGGYALGINNHTFQFNSGSNWLDSGIIVDDGKWHHLVGTVDSSHTVTLYVDGQKHGFTTTNINLNNSSNDLIFGAASDHSLVTICNMMRAALYNTALSANTILSHYNTGIAFNLFTSGVVRTVSGTISIKDRLNIVDNFNEAKLINTGGHTQLLHLQDKLNISDFPVFSITKKTIESSVYANLILNEPDLISYWKLNEVVYSTAYDSKDSNDGIYNGIINLYQNSNIGSLNHCIYFRGNSTDFINVVDAANIDALVEMTIEAWIKLANITDNSYIFISKYIPTSTYGGYALRVYQKNLQFYAGNGVSWFDSNKIVADQQWHHVVGTIDSSGNIKTYVDGNLTNSASGYSENLSNTTQNLTIGRPLTNNILLPGFVDNNPYNGYIMHVAIYDAVLSVDKILNHYKIGTNQTSTIVKNEIVFSELSGQIE